MHDTHLIVQLDCLKGIRDTALVRSREAKMETTY